MCEIEFDRSEISSFVGVIFRFNHVLTLHVKEHSVQHRRVRFVRFL